LAGFTLIEISIVMAIIGILAATATSQYMRALDTARMARAIVELRGIAAQIEPMGDDDTQLPTALADVGIATVDPWGTPYQYLLLQGELPPGYSSTTTGLPNVAANPAEPPGNENGGNGGGGGSDGGSGGGNGGGGNPAIALARKDGFLVPINSDFDLYSMGPDRESKPTLSNPVSRDDIIRGADGAFYGLAEKF
jgi:general secretion pathway protein G